MQEKSEKTKHELFGLNIIHIFPRYGYWDNDNNNGKLQWTKIKLYQMLIFKLPIFQTCLLLAVEQNRIPNINHIYRFVVTIIQLNGILSLDDFCVCHFHFIFFFKFFFWRPNLYGIAWSILIESALVHTQCTARVHESMFRWFEHRNVLCLDQYLNGTVIDYLIIIIVSYRFQFARF